MTEMSGWSGRGEEELVPARKSTAGARDPLRLEASGLPEGLEPSGATGGSVQPGEAAFGQLLCSGAGSRESGAFSKRSSGMSPEADRALPALEGPWGTAMAPARRRIGSSATTFARERKLSAALGETSPAARAGRPLAVVATSTDGPAGEPMEGEALGEEEEFEELEGPEKPRSREAGDACSSAATSGASPATPEGFVGRREDLE